MDVLCSNYLNRMVKDGTFGDEIILRAAPELITIEFVIISTLGRAAETTIIPKNIIPQGCVYLEHFAENHEENCDVHHTVEDPDISNEFFDSEIKKNYR